MADGKKPSGLGAQIYHWLSEFDWHRRIVEFASIATVATVGFAGYQLFIDRQIRYVDARLKAIDVIVPRYSIRQHNDFVRYRTVEELDDSGHIEIPLTLEAFNESGLNFKMGAFAQRCIHNLEKDEIPNEKLKAIISISDQFPPIEGPLEHRIPKGKSDLKIRIGIDQSQLSLSEVRVVILLYDITVAKTVLASVKEALSEYEDADIIKGVRDEFSFDLIFTDQTDEEIYSATACEVAEDGRFDDWKEKVIGGDYSISGIH